MKVIEVIEIRTNTYQVKFNNGKEVVVYAPNVETAIKRAIEKLF